MGDYKMNKKGGLQSIIISLLLVGLFTFSIIQFGTNLSTLNNANQSITDDPTIGQLQTNVNKTIVGFEGSASSAFKSAEADAGKESALQFVINIVSLVPQAFVLVGKAFLIPKDIMKFVLITLGVGDQDSGDGLAFLLYAIIISITAIVGLFAIWRFWKTGT